MEPRQAYRCLPGFFFLSYHDMTLEAAYTYLQHFPGAEETFPFGPQHLVFKVRGKMYALLAFDEIPPRLSLKCDPDRAVQLRDRFPAVQPAYHMNKRHWNMVAIDGSVPAEYLQEMIDHSYALVVAKLLKSQREELAKGGIEDAGKCR